MSYNVALTCVIATMLSALHLGSANCMQAGNVLRLASSSEPFGREILLSDELPDAKKNSDRLGWVLHAERNRDGLWRRSAELTKKLAASDRDRLKLSAASLAKQLANESHADEPFDPSKVVKRLRQSIDDYTNAIGTPSEMPDESASILARSAPIGRLATTLLRGLEDKELDGAPPGSTVYFSNLSLAGCTLLKSTALKAIQQYVLESLMLKKEWDKATRAFSSQELGKYSRLFPAIDESLAGRVVVLGVERTNLDASFYVQVFTLDGKLESALFDFAPSASFGQWTPKLVPFDEGTLAFRNHSLFNNPEALLKFKADQSHLKEARTWLDPVVEDYVSRGAYFALKALAKEQGASHFLACAPDWILATVESCVRGGELDVAKFSKALQVSGACEIKVEGDCLLIRPKNPLESEAKRADRAGIATLWGEAAQGRLNLRNVSKFYNSQRQFVGRGNNPVIDLVTQAVWELFPKGGDWGRKSPSSLQLLGDLSDQEWRNLVTGQRFVFTPGQHLESLRLYLKSPGRPFSPVARSAETQAVPSTGLGMASFAASIPSVLLSTVVDERTAVMEVWPGWHDVPFVGRDSQTGLIGPGKVKMEDPVVSGIWYSFKSLMTSRGPANLTIDDAKQIYSDFETKLRFYYSQQTVISLAIQFGSFQTKDEVFMVDQDYSIAPRKLSEVPGFPHPNN